MRRVQTTVIRWILIAAFLSGCGALGQGEETEVDLAALLPAEFPTTGPALRIDVNQDGREEWLVFFHVDPIVDNAEGSPTIAAVYRAMDDRDSRMPPSLEPSLLWLPSQGYLCLYDCKAQMQDVISAAEGNELVILDRRSGKTVGAAIFRWREDLNVKDRDVNVASGPCDGCMLSNGFSATLVCGGFVPLGHFRGDSVILDPNKPDQVTVIQRRDDRSDLAYQEIYTPESGHYYTQEVQNVYELLGQLRVPDEKELVFASGPPQKPIDVKVPEKLVMALYRNFKDRGEIKQYFTNDAWERIGQDCPGGNCGCWSRRENVQRVMVKDIAFELGPEEQQISEVAVQVICINKNGETDPPGPVIKWTLQRQADNTWRLSNVTRMQSGE